MFRFLFLLIERSNFVLEKMKNQLLASFSALHDVMTSSSLYFHHFLDHTTSRWYNDQGLMLFTVFYVIFLSVSSVCFNFGRGRRDSMIGCLLKPPSRTASETRQCSWTLTIDEDDLDCREVDCRRTAGGCRSELWAMSRGRSVRKYNLLSRLLLAAGFAASSFVEHRHGTLRNQI